MMDKYIKTNALKSMDKYKETEGVTWREVTGNTDNAFLMAHWGDKIISRTTWGHSPQTPTILPSIPSVCPFFSGENFPRSSLLHKSHNPTHPNLRNTRNLQVSRFYWNSPTLGPLKAPISSSVLFRIDHWTTMKSDTAISLSGVIHRCLVAHLGRISPILSLVCMTIIHTKGEPQAKHVCKCNDGPAWH